MNIKSLAVFCGSSSGTDPVYEKEAEKLGEYLAKNDIQLVFGGGRVGLMGTIADSVLTHGGKAIGTIPESLFQKEVGHTGIQELRVVQTMHERKKIMYDLSDAFIALPGGYGTLDEFCEVLTWSQLGYHKKPMGFLNVKGYFDHLLGQFNHSLKEGFITQAHIEMIIVENNIEQLFKRLKDYQHTDSQKWIVKDIKP